MLSIFQPGFRKLHSCETRLFITVKDLTPYQDRGTKVDIAILEFSTAFDMVPHEHLLYKLSYYWIQGNIDSWIPSFLKDRHQRVTVINSEHSDKVDIHSVLPQRTASGSLLFLLYLNDLPDNVKSLEGLFASCPNTMCRNLANEIQSFQVLYHVNMTECQDGTILIFCGIYSNYLGVTISKHLQQHTHLPIS